MIDSTRWACELGRCHMVDHQSSLNSSSSALDLLLVKRGCCSACIFYYLAQKTAQSRSHIETRVIKVIYVHESGDVPIS